MEDWSVDWWMMCQQSQQSHQHRIAPASCSWRCPRKKRIGCKKSDCLRVGCHFLDVAICCHMLPLSCIFIKPFFSLDTCTILRFSRALGIWIKLQHLNSRSSNGDDFANLQRTWASWNSRGTKKKWRSGSLNGKLTRRLIRTRNFA